MVTLSGSGPRARGFVRVATVVGAVVLPCACSLDERTLEEGYTVVNYEGGSGAGGGRGGSSGAGSRSAGQAGAVGSSGSAGASGDSGVAVGNGGDGAQGPSAGGAAGEPMSGQGGTGATGGQSPNEGDAGAREYPLPCSIVDGAATGDCSVSMVSNATLDEGWTGWYSEPGVAMDWSREDAFGSEASGSLAVGNCATGTTANLTRAAARQCVSMSGEGAVNLAAMVFIPGGQSVAARAALGLAFYSTLDCSGTPVHELVTGDVMLSDFWLPMEASTMAPSSTQSFVVRLVATKRFLDAEIEVLFDNVLVQSD